MAIFKHLDAPSPAVSVANKKAALCNSLKMDHGFCFALFSLGRP